MPEATAAKTAPVPEVIKPVDLDKHRTPPIPEIKQQIRAAGGGLNPEEVRLGKDELEPIQTAIIGTAHQIDESEKKVQPDTYNEDKNPLTHYLPEFPGVDLHLATRTGEGSELISIQKARQAKAMAEGNKGIRQPGVFKKFKNWLYDDQKAA